MGVNVPDAILIGRFSGDNYWPVLGDRRGLTCDSSGTGRARHSALTRKASELADGRSL